MTTVSPVTQIEASCSQEASSPRGPGRSCQRSSGHPLPGGQGRAVCRSGLQGRLLPGQRGVHLPGCPVPLRGPQGVVQAHAGGGALQGGSTPGRAQPARGHPVPGRAAKGREPIGSGRRGRIAAARRNVPLDGLGTGRWTAVPASGLDWTAGWRFQGRRRSFGLTPGWCSM